MSLLDKMMDRNMMHLKKMQGKMLDMQEEVYDEKGEQIKRVNQKSAEFSAPGTKIHYEAVASGVKEGLAEASTKNCVKCGKKIADTAKYCSECGASQE